jgi:hypothetical protein
MARSNVALDDADAKAVAAFAKSLASSKLDEAQSAGKELWLWSFNGEPQSSPFRRCGFLPEHRRRVLAGTWPRARTTIWLTRWCDACADENLEVMHQARVIEAASGTLAPELVRWVLGSLSSIPVRLRGASPLFDPGSMACCRCRRDADARQERRLLPAGVLAAAQPCHAPWCVLLSFSA